MVDKALGYIIGKHLKNENLYFGTILLFPGLFFFCRINAEIVARNKQQNVRKGKNPIKSIINSNPIYLCILLQALWQIDAQLSTV